MNKDGGTIARAVLTALAAVHLVIAAWHGAAHAELAVGLSTWQSLYVDMVIILAPLVAVGLLWTRYVTVGLWLFLVAMTAALLFGAYFHYVFVSPDNIHHLPTGSAAAQTRFVISAAILALDELGTALCAAFVLGMRVRQV